MKKLTDVEKLRHKTDRCDARCRELYRSPAVRAWYKACKRRRRVFEQLQQTLNAQR